MDCYSCEYYDEVFFPETGDEEFRCNKPSTLKCENYPVAEDDEEDDS